MRRREFAVLPSRDYAVHQLRRVADPHGRQSKTYALQRCRRARSGTRANRLVQTADTPREWWVTVDGECVIAFKGTARMSERQNTLGN